MKIASFDCQYSSDQRGRTRETWRRTVERQLEKKGLRTWAAAASAAEDMQNSLEAESLRPNFPLGERINDDDSSVLLLKR